MVGANCLRAVTTSHIVVPHRPLSRRRRATSATACWPRTGLVAGFQVDGGGQAQRVGGRLRQHVATARGSRPVSCRTPCSVAAQALGIGEPMGTRASWRTGEGGSSVAAFARARRIRAGGRLPAYARRDRVGAGRKVGAP
jgi:hypothetical protein